MATIIDELAATGQRGTDAFAAFRRATSLLERERARVATLDCLETITTLAEVLRVAEPDPAIQRLARDWLAAVTRARRELNRGTATS